MNRIAMIAVSLFLIGMGGYQTLHPKRMIRRNMNRPMTWTPKWMKERMFSAPNVWSTRLAGAGCCIAGCFFLAKGLVGF